MGNTVDALARSQQQQQQQQQQQRRRHRQDMHNDLIGDSTAQEELRDVDFAMESIGQQKSSAGQYEEAIECHSHSLQIAQWTGDANRQVRALGHIGIEIDALANSLAGGKLSHSMRENIGSTMESLGRFEDALEHHTSRLEFAQQMDDRIAEVAALNNIGGAIDALARSQQHHSQDTMHNDLIGDSTAQEELRDVDFAMESIGQQKSSAGQYEEAIECHSHSLQIAQRTGECTHNLRAL